jgi:hypothetical protein
MRWLSMCGVFCALYITSVVLRGLPLLFCLGTSRVLYVYFGYIKNPDVFLRLSPNPLHQRDVPIYFAINFMYVFMGKRGHF